MKMFFRAAAATMLLAALFSCKKEEKVIHVSSVSVTPAAIELTEGESQALTAKILPDNATNKAITWSSSDAAVATVSEEGEVKALKPGTATVKATAKDGGVEGSCAITVIKKIIHPESVTLEPESLSLVEGTSGKIAATVLPENADNKAVVWSSSNKEVATVDQEGNVSALVPGEAEITATTEDGGVKGICALTVEKLIIPIKAITLDKTEVTITKGLDYTLHATLDPENTTDPSLVWTTSDEEIAVVNQSGKVVAFGVGTATVTATSVSWPDVKAECVITVTSDIVSVKGISLNASTKTIYLPDTFQLEATITPSDATDQNVSWSSNAPGVATVSATGLVTSVSTGTAAITAITRDGGKSATCNVTVDHTRITKITFAEGSSETIVVEAGTTYQLTPVITPDYASNKQVNWSTSNYNRATVSSTGKVTFPVYDNGIVSIEAITKVSNRVANQNFEVRIPVSSVSLPSSFNVSVGGTAVPELTVLPANAYDKSVTWTSDDPTVASVASDGTITGVKKGSTTIHATSKYNTSLKADCAVTVLGDNKVSVNGEAAVAYKTGQLLTVLEGKTVTSLEWTEESLMNGTDISTFQGLKSTLTSVDMRKLSFTDDGTTYSGYGSSSAKVVPSVLPEKMMNEFTSLTTAKLSESVTVIGTYAMYYCRNLTTLVLPPALEIINAYAFYNCYSLTGVTLPETLTKIDGSNAFANCTNLTSFSFPDACTSGGSGTLSGCSRLVSIHFGKNYSDYSYIPYMLSNCFTLETITVSSGNKVISLENGCVVYDRYTLMQPTACPSGNFVANGSRKEYWGSFNYAPYTTIEYAEGVESMVRGTFNWCSNLTQLILPSTIKTFTPGSIYACNKMTTLVCKAATPPTISSNVMSGFSALAAIKVPAASVDAYKAADVWSTKAALITAIDE